MNLKKIINYLNEKGGKVVFYDEESEGLFELAKVEGNSVAEQSDDQELIEKVNHDISLLQENFDDKIANDFVESEDEDTEEQFYIEPVE
ncbi:hypothetical protein HN958_01350 [Candidatus Falkowbacteria bacterium]|jgi:hypothetical protein|nr:hypothetical protein [Candidatus Falkowbacteria bacterium]MBT7007131.1 hypothetical protein [Candidatus Falkowbacteria bacterium]